MTRTTNHLAAAFAAILMTLATFQQVVTVPAEGAPAIAGAPILA